MKERRLILLSVFIVCCLLPVQELFSQEDEGNKFKISTDFYSSYLFRGTKYGSGPSIQPLLKFSTDLFSAGGWGSFDFNGYQESDLFFSFSLPAGFSLGMTDYYYPGLDYFDYSTETGSHSFELNAGFRSGGVSASANYILNEARGAGSAGSDLYFQAGYSFRFFNLFAGAGNGWHTSSGNFNICNLGLGISKTIKVTESFSVPVTGQVISNPEREKLYIVIGFTL